MIKKRILIVEDEPLTAMEEQSIIENMGHEVCAIANSREEAVSLALTESPDLVLMDIRLTGEMDGIEAARRIRQIREVPVIFVTAQTGTMAESLTGEIRVSKPFSPDQLSGAVSRLLDEGCLC
jgi:CheY-like chemotaxis protein